MDGRSGGGSGGGREDPWTSVGGLDFGDVGAGFRETRRGGRAGSVDSDLHDIDGKGYQSDPLDDIDSDEISDEEEEEEEILSEEMILEVAGVDDLSQVKELELVFEKLSPDLSVLRSLISVQQITFIGNQLGEMEFDFSLLSNTLQVLCLARQGIQRIDCLGTLPRLRELYLYENNITRIEGLEGCSHLQKLWLHSNKIEAIENLLRLGDLRELWLQDNRIQSIKNVETLVNLQVLNLSHNPIHEFRDLELLSTLPALFDLGLNDPHFGPCPVVFREGYRQFVVFFLKQVRILDGEMVGEDDRRRVEDTYLQSVIDFNDRVEDIRRETAEQMDRITERVVSYKEKGQGLTKAFLESLSALERVVHTGRSEVATEHRALVATHESNLNAFEKVISDAKAAYQREVDSLVSEEKRRIDAEGKYFASLRKTGESLRRELSFLLGLNSASRMHVVASHVADRTPERRWIDALFESSFGEGSRVRGIPTVRVFAVFRLRYSEMGVVGSGESESHEKERTNPGRGSGVVGEVKRGTDDFSPMNFCFALLPPDQAHDLISGWDAAVEPPKPTHLFCQPADAILHSTSSHDRASAIRVCTDTIFLAFRINSQNIRITSAELPSDGKMDPSLFEENGISYDVCQSTFEGVDRILPKSWFGVLTPAFVVLLTPSRMLFSAIDFDVLEDEILRSALLSMSTDPIIDEKLLAIEREVEREFWKTQQQIWEELEPGVCSSLRSKEAKLEALHREINALQSATEMERQKQERTVRDFRAQLQLQRDRTSLLPQSFIASKHSRR